MEWFDVTREQVITVLEFAARSLDAPPPVVSQDRVPVEIAVRRVLRDVVKPHIDQTFDPDVF
jgi:hypothetical protein